MITRVVGRNEEVGVPTATFRVSSSEDEFSSVVGFTGHETNSEVVRVIRFVVVNRSCVSRSVADKNTNNNISLEVECFCSRSRIFRIRSRIYKNRSRKHEIRSRKHMILHPLHLEYFFADFDYKKHATSVSFRF